MSSKSVACTIWKWCLKYMHTQFWLNLNIKCVQSPFIIGWLIIVIYYKFFLQESICYNYEWRTRRPTSTLVVPVYHITQMCPKLFVKKKNENCCWSKNFCYFKTVLFPFLMQDAIWNNGLKPRVRDASQTHPTFDDISPFFMRY